MQTYTARRNTGFGIGSKEHWRRAREKWQKDIWKHERQGERHKRDSEALAISQGDLWTVLQTVDLVLIT